MRVPGIYGFQVNASMDASAVESPTNEMELVPNKIEEKKETETLIHCDLYDTEIVHKIAQMLLPGLATACVDNTTGDVFRTPASVAVDIRKEMVEYLTQRSESFVAEMVVPDDDLGGKASDHPYDIICDFVEDFATLKRSLVGRVSGWLLSEKREDKIDDMAQEMEMSKFWLLERREAIAQTLLKNVDFKNEFHCDAKLKSSEELAKHILSCRFRPMNCTNEGCTSRFIADHMEKHDSLCPFKIIPCEQKCPDSMMRREMDKHCITVCPMKLVNCPFYQVGCKSLVPQSKIEEHVSESLNMHLSQALQSIHKEASPDDLKLRAENIESSFSSELAAAPDLRSFRFVLKDIEAKLGPLEDSRQTISAEDCTKASDSAVVTAEVDSQI